MTLVLFSILGFLVFENLVELYLTLRQVSQKFGFFEFGFTIFFLPFFKQISFAFIKLVKMFRRS